MNEFVSFDQIKGSVASLVSLWSKIEIALTQSIQKLDSGKRRKPVQGIAASLDVWSRLVDMPGEDREIQREQCRVLVAHLTNALTVRNLVCHGLVGYSSGGREGERPAHLSVHLGDDRRDLSWPELQAMFAWMSKAPWLVEALTRAAIEPDAGRAAKMLPNREHFPT